MAQAAVAAEVHQALDVGDDFAAQVALDQIIAVDRLADLQHLASVSWLTRRSAGIPTLRANVLGVLLTNAVNVL